MSNKQNAKEASRCLANLNAYAAVVGILENGTVRGGGDAVNDIIAICEREMKSELAEHDRYIAKIK